MADENATAPEAENAVDPTVATALAPKKTRAPRQKKVLAEAVSLPTKAARGANKAQAAKSSATVVTDEAALALETKPGRGRKGIPRPRVAKTTASDASPVISSNVDEFADLLALEEENKQLRKSLSEKLRAENADLRRKLGQA